jgi:recombination protein RecT
MSEINTVGPALPRENFRKIRECRTLDELFSSAEFRERIVSSVPHYMTNDRMLSVVLRAHVANPLLVKATPQSFAGACLTATHTGLEPNSALAEAHLIPFKTTLRGRGGQPDREVIQIQVIFGYQGLLKLAHNSGRLLSTSANVVYADADIFDWMEGSETFLKFKRGGRRERREDEQPTHAYFHARLVGGGESMEVWPWGDVLRIRNMSQGFRRAKRALEEAQARGARPPFTWTEAPWVKWLDQMARKTMIRAGVKYLPKSVELANAARLDELHEHRNIDYARVIDAAGNAEEPDYSSAAIALAEGTDDGEMEETTGVDAATTTVVVAAHAPAFEHYLIDDVGEPIGPYLDPVKWASDFINIWKAIRRDDLKEGLVESNEQALADARRAPIADQLLAVVDEARDLPAPTPLLVETNADGKVDWKSYVKRFQFTVYGWRGDLNAWLEIQRDTMQQAPLATRLLLTKAATERASQLNTTLPEWAASLAATGQRIRRVADNSERRETQDARWVRETIEQVSAAKDEAAVREIADSVVVLTVMRRLRRENHDFWKEVDEAFVNRLTELQGHGNDDDEPPPQDAA